MELTEKVQAYWSVTVQRISVSQFVIRIIKSELVKQTFVRELMFSQR
jgi:hypothetical protein